MVDVTFKNTNILNTLLLAFYAFDAVFEYPKESTGHSKNIHYSFFLNIQCILICKHRRSIYLPIGVENLLFPD